MSTEGINLVCCHGSDGGALFIDDGGEQWDRFVYENKGDITECTMEEGLAECDQYFKDTHNITPHKQGKWQALRKDFMERVAGLTGKFYVWGVEYDCDLMFVPDDQTDVWKDYEPDDDDD